MSRLCHVRASDSLILLHVFRGQGQTETVVYGGRTYDCRKVVQSFESTAGHDGHPQSVIDGCVSGQP